MSTKLIFTAVALTATAMSIAYCAGKKKGIAVAKAEETFDDLCEENSYFEEEKDCSECDKCEAKCFTEADYENRND